MIKNIFNNVVLILLSIMFTMNTAMANSNYILKEGDEVRIELLSDDTLNKTVQINKVGEISLPEIEEVRIAGLTVLEAEGKLKNELSFYFKNVDYLKLEVLSKNRFISVLGYVDNPTEVLLQENENIQMAIKKAGGVRRGAQLNKVQIRRATGKTELFDYKKYLDSGDLNLLPQLKTLDSLFIPASPIVGNIQADFNLEMINAQSGSLDVSNSVTIFGEVHVPGIYKFDGERNLVEYIMKAGGVTRYADVSKIRIVINGEPLLFNLKYFLDSGQVAKDIKLTKGSTIYVPIMVKDVEKTGTQVFLMGEVKKAGVYEVQEKTGFIDVLGSAGGPTRFADTTKIKVIHADGKITTFNLNNYTDGIGNQKIPSLVAGDVILIPEKLALDQGAWLKTPSNEAVHVLGAVNNPGRYPWSDEMSLIDLISHAKGPTQQADLEKVKILTYGQNGDQLVKYFNMNTIMKEGVNFDQLPKIKAGYTIVFEELPHDPTDNKSKWIRQSSERSVYVFGAVKASGRYAFDEHMSFLDILAAVEGPEQDADINAIQIVHRNSFESNVETFDFGLYLMTGDESLLPKIKMGDSIFVPYKDTHFTNKNSENSIKVMGAVGKTGFYKYNDDMTLIDVLANVEGFDDDALTASVLIVNMSCCSTSRSYKFDLEGFMSEPDYIKLPALRPGDIVFVPSQSHASWDKFMDVVGDAVLIASLMALVGVL